MPSLGFRPFLAQVRVGDPPEAGATAGEARAWDDGMSGGKEVALNMCCQTARVYFPEGRYGGRSHQGVVGRLLVVGNDLSASALPRNPDEASKLFKGRTGAFLSSVECRSPSPKSMTTQTIHENTVV